MNDIKYNINESLNFEKCHAVCVNELKTKYHTFAKGEEVDATRINPNWWIIDSIGISEKSFKHCFKKNPTTK